MYCSECGKKIIDSSKFCNFCGSPVEGAGKRVIIEKCPECGGQMTAEGDRIHCKYCDYAFTVDESDAVKLKQIEREMEADKIGYEEIKRSWSKEDEKDNIKGIVVASLILIAFIVFLRMLS